MNKFASLLMLFMLFASLGFAWTAGYETLSCETPYSVLGINFTVAQYNQSLACNAKSFTGYGFLPTPSTYTTDALKLYYINSTAIYLSKPTVTGTLGITNWTYGNFSQETGFYDVSLSQTFGQAQACSGTASAYLYLSIEGTTYTLIHRNSTIDSCGLATASSRTSNFTITSISATQNNISITTTNVNATVTGSTCCACSSGATTVSEASTIQTITVNKTSAVTFSVYQTPGPANCGTTNDIRVNYTSAGVAKTPPSIETWQWLGNNGAYQGTHGTSVVISDFTTGNRTASTSTYCRSLLYFNNPYYGNIQLIPKITYIPGTNAFPDFINSSDNSAYLPNNTISYIFDSVTSSWYIVPATVCSSYSIVGSTSTLQYNPTATGTAPGGTVPIDVSSISGSCTYTTGTRLISCTGTDTSSTMSSLALSAYLSGNTTDLCGSTVGGATGTLTCTLPAQNGTYNVFFYGTDANLFLHTFATKTITIGSSVSGYGRDAYIAVLLLFGVAVLLMSGNIAVSMLIGCFGLFVALALGALPISDAPVVVFFTVIALVLAYRLKV